MSEQTGQLGKSIGIVLLRTIAGILGLLALIAIVLDFGVWEEVETHRGPFSIQIPNEPKGLYFTVDDKSPLPCCLGLQSDDGGQVTRSDLRLWINGQAMGPAHSQHGDIRRGGTLGFSNWAGSVIFSLPPGVPNTAQTVAEVRYSIRPVPGLTWVLAILAIVLFLLSFWDTFRAYYTSSQPVRRERPPTNPRMR